MAWDAWDTDVQSDEGVTWGDYGKAVGAGASTVASNVAGGLRYYFEQGQQQNAADLFGAAQGAAGKATEDITDSMTKEGRDRLSASITSEKFWEHPISSAALKATNMSPMVVASILPGGLVADAASALALTAVGGGALNAAGVIDEIYKKTDSLSNSELANKSDYFAGLLSMYDEKEARRQYNESLMGMKPAIAFAIGAGVGYLGPAGNMIRGAKGAAAHGAVPGAVEGAASLAGQSGSSDYMVQSAEVEGGLKKDIDKGALVDAVLEGGAFGAGLGGAAGAIAGRKGRAKKTVTPEVNDNAAQTQDGRTGGTVPPVEAAPVGNKQNEPTRSETQYPKAEAAKGKSKGPVAEVVEPGAPTVAEKAAVAEVQQQVLPEPKIPEVPRVPEAPPAPAPAPVAQEVAPSVPPRVPVDNPAAPPPEAGAPVAPVRGDEAPAARPVDAPSGEPVKVEIVPQPPAAVATPEPVKPVEPRAPRVLENISPEAKALEAAGNKKLKENLKAAEKEPKEATGERNRGAAEKAIIAEREQHAKEVFEKHAPDRGNDVPTKREDRAAMSAQLGAMLEDAASRGLVARESLPEAIRQKVLPPKKKNGEPIVKREKPTPEEYRQVHIAIPEKVAAAGGHVMYLREAMAIKRLLDKQSPLTKKDRERIQKFVVEERAFKEGDAEMMKARRKEDGEREKRVDQGDVEAPAGKVAKAMEDLGNSDHLSPEEKLIRAEEEELPDGVEIKQGPSVKHIEVKPVERIKLNAAEKRAARKAAFAKPAPKEIAAPVAEKKPVIAAESDAAVTRAGKETNTNPSEAQKEAGNYAKGTVEWNGLHVAIENPKGSERRGVMKGEDGDDRPWSVKMQDHYGYIKRTKGADGDQVDVFMGPNPKSDKVWVIDQQDFGGKFDEHKAMLGFDSQADALQAYDRAFSDGRGFERVKDMQSMSVDEFKDWVKSDKPRKAAKASIDSALKTSVQSALDPRSTINSITSTKARDVLKSLNLEHLAGVPKAIADLMRNRLTAIAGDVDVHIIDKGEMARAAGDVSIAFDPDGDGSIGLHRLMMNGKNDVMLRADAMRTPAQTAHVAMHEIAHAATVRAIVENPELHTTINQMMAETKAFLEFVPDIKKELSYAFGDAKEFVAEAFSNPKVQEILAQVPMSAELAKRVKMPGKPTLWDAFVSIVRKAIEKTIGPIPEGHRMIEGILRLGNQFEAHEANVAARKARGEGIRVEIKQPAEMTSKLVSQVKDLVDNATKRVKGEGLQEQMSKPHLMLRTMDQIAQVAGDYFRGNNPVRRVADLVEMIRVKAANNLRKAEPIIDELYSLEKKYKGAMWDHFTKLVHDETMANVFADRDLAGNAHLGKDTLRGVWGKAQHADLAARYKELPEDLKAARAKAMKFFTDQQNAMSLGIIKNRILKLMDIEDDALARRIHEGSVTDADRVRVGEHAMELIQQAKELAKTEGPYFPLMRRGDHVVRATYDIAPPANAKQIDANTFEFTGPKARKEALAWAAKQDSKPTLQSRWVDKNTGDTHFPDGTRVTKSDTDAEQRFRVSVQNEHVEFFNSAREAQAAALDLAKTGNIHVKGVEERRFEPGDRQADMLSTQMRNMVEGLKKREKYKDLTPTQKNELIQSLNEASIRFLGSTRIQSRRLPRRYVEGASKDLTRNTLEYAQSSSGYLAKLEHQPALEDAMKAMREAVTDDDHKSASLARSAIANEIERRVATSNTYEEGGAWSAATKRIMTLSFLDKLAGPSHNIINSLQPSMVTFPVQAAKYGVGKSFDALSRAYSDITGLGIVKAGLKDTLKKARDSAAKTTDLMGDIKKNLNAKEREMMDYLAERGSIDPDAGFEVDRLIKSRDGLGGKIDAGLGKFESIARQMPQAIEMVNRAATALSTYRLEIGRGASHEKAMLAAQEMVNNTQGLYSASNSAPIFNHPVAKLSLQFKKYGQMMYHLLGSNIGKAIKNAEPGDRAEALRTLAGITATHVAMAGALGLPTEPFKYLLMGAQAAGLTSVGWNDVENKVREQATNWFGKTGGEIATRGLPRLIGVDLSSRVGLDSLSSFGEPKSNKDSDVKSWMFDTLAGAPTALVSDWVKGMNNLWAGNFTKAGEQLVPMKFAADAIKAYRLSTEGKKGSSGKETMKPYSPIEAAVRAAGFTPAREAEEGAKRSAFYSNQKRDSEERTALTSAWVSAKPTEKMTAWKNVQAFNRGKPRDQQITMSDLTRAADRRRKEGDAIKTTKRDKQYLDRAEATYNTR